MNNRSLINSMKLGTEWRALSRRSIPSQSRLPRVKDVHVAADRFLRPSKCSQKEEYVIQIQWHSNHTTNVSISK